MSMKIKVIIMLKKFKTIINGAKLKKRFKRKLYLLKENYKFKDIHKGERCFILGNGPSLETVDFSKLQNEITFTVNQISRRSDFMLLKTNYHLWVDERFFNINKNKEEDLELIKTMESVNTKDNVPTVFYKLPAYDMVKEFDLDKQLDIHYFMENGSGVEVNGSCDFCKFIPSFSTVVQYAVLLAVYMGFKDIYLLGCDCTGIINTVQSRIGSSGSMAYGYSITENERKRMEKSNTMYPIQDELRWYANIFDEYELLKKYCLEKKVNLFNATKGSLIDCLPKVDFGELL